MHLSRLIHSSRMAAVNPDGPHLRADDAAVLKTVFGARVQNREMHRSAHSLPLRAHQA